MSLERLDHPDAASTWCAERRGEGLGIGFGILAPAASGTSTWGDGDGFFTAADGSPLGGT